MSTPLRQFLLMSIAAIALLLASITYFHLQLSDGYLKEHLAADNETLATVLLNSLIGDQLEIALQQRPQRLTTDDRAIIDARLGSDLRTVPVFKVKVYGIDSTVLYSTKNNEIGRKAETNPGVSHALRGYPISDIVRRDKVNELDGTADKIDLHQQYIPIRLGPYGEIHGVFEIYADISKILKEAERKQELILPGFAAVILIFYFAFGLLFFRMNRSLQHERRGREAHLAELNTVKGELEGRVQERTAELDRSKNFLQAVIDGIGTPLLVIRPDHSIALMNRAATRLLPEGADPEDYRHCYQISHRRDTPCEGEDHPCSFDQVMKHGRPARVRHTHFDANNQPFIVDLLSTPLYGEDGTFEGVIEVEHDVTQIVRMQAGLVESEARLQAIMDHVPDAILTCDAEGFIQSVNPSALHLFGSPDSDLIGNELRDVLQGAVAENEYESNKTVQREMMVKRKDGTEIPVDLWIGPLNIEGDTSCVAVIRDISAQLAAQEELEKTRQQYFHQEKMAAIGQLAAGILHEVGNPIAAIAGAAHELKSITVCGGRPSEECPFDIAVARNINVIDDQTTRLGRITREIADFASPRPRERELLDLNSLIRSTSRLLNYDRRFRNVDLTLNLNKDVPAIVGVADQLTQVFMNLLINALDACTGADKNGSGKIHLESELDGDRVHVLVRDNGCGMSEDTLTHVMEPFYTTKSVGKGTGLGLSLCDTIILAHGGVMHIESSEGEGTTVHVFLPIELTDIGEAE